MYAGPMWAIGYTFVPGSSGGVYGQIQSENYLDPTTGNIGVAVSTLSVSGNSRTETSGDSPTRTFNYSGVDYSITPISRGKRRISGMTETDLVLPRQTPRDTRPLLRGSRASERSRY